MHWSSAILVAWALMGCATVGSVRAPAPATPAGVPPVEEPVSFSMLEQRVGELIDGARDADQRDRLVAMRELMFAMRGQEPTAQRRVYAYLVKAIGVEERSRPEPLADTAATLPLAPIAETPLDEPATGSMPAPSPEPEAAGPGPAPTPGPTLSPPALPAPAAPVVPLDRQARVSGARAALADRRYEDALQLLAPLSDGEARLLRQEAVDGGAAEAWARAKTDLATARSLPPGPDREAALRAVAEALRAINARFPGHADYPLVEEALRAVEAELGAPAP